MIDNAIAWNTLQVSTKEVGIQRDGSGISDLSQVLLMPCTGNGRNGLSTLNWTCHQLLRNATEQEKLLGFHLSTL